MQPRSVEYQSVPRAVRVQYLKEELRESYLSQARTRSVMEKMCNGHALRAYPGARSASTKRLGYRKITISHASPLRTKFRRKKNLESASQLWIAEVLGLRRSTATMVSFIDKISTVEKLIT